VSRADEAGEDSFRDVLGRGVLAAHLEELLVRLTSKQRAGTARDHARRGTDRECRARAGARLTGG
jgi:hypothetical protein